MILKSEAITMVTELPSMVHVVLSLLNCRSGFRLRRLPLQPGVAPLLRRRAVLRGAGQVVHQERRAARLRPQQAP